MILNNTQANIFKVNGGIADNFANRPAASGSFYIFYSIDTQEIFYDNGAWVLLGSGSSGMNIYNSDGTLTGNRTLNGANNDLTFNNIFQLYFEANNEVYNRVNNTWLSVNNGSIFSKYNYTDIGLKLDFANEIYTFGDITRANLDIQNQGGGNAFYLNAPPYTSISAVGSNNELYINSYLVEIIGTSGNLITFRLDDTNEIIKTTKQGNDIGLKLDFANNLYTFGQLTGGNNSYIEVDDIRPRISTKFFGNSFSDGFDIVGGEYAILGFQNGTNQLQIKVSEIGNETFASNIVGVNGFKLDYNFSVYQFGQITGGNITKFIISDAGREIYTSINNSVNGLLISQSNDNYKFGVFNGGNVTNIAISDGAVYPIRLNGNNLSSGTASGSSGQHLKININGTNYKIALLNP